MANLIGLPLSVRLTLRVSDELDERLEAGEPAAFAILERELLNRLNSSSSDELQFGDASELVVEDAGLHNVSSEEDIRESNGRK